MVVEKKGWPCLNIFPILWTWGGTFHQANDGAGLDRVGLAGGDPRVSAILSTLGSFPFASVPSITSFIMAIVWSKLRLRLLGAVPRVVPKENRRP